MTDPYKPVSSQRTAEPDLVASGEVRSPLDQFLQRLVDLGATPDEVQRVADAWDQLDPDDDPDPEAWTRARRDAFAQAGDAELLAALQATRDEYKLGHTTEAEAEAEAAALALDAALAEATGRMAGNVQSILAWVADDPYRAEAVLRLEVAPEGADRTTLVGPLTQQLGWDTDALDALRASYGPTVLPEAPEAASGAQGGQGVDAEQGA